MHYHFKILKHLVQLKAILVGSELRAKITNNIIWLIVDRVIQVVLSFLIGVWIARYLGPERFGVYNYALAFISLFAPLCQLGLDQIVIRDFVKKKVNNDEIIATTIILRFFSSIIVYSIIVLCTFFIFKNDCTKQNLILISGIVFFANVMDIFEYWFKSEVLSKYTVYARTISSLLTSTLKVIAILLVQNVYVFAYINVFGFFFYGFGVAYFYFSKNHWKIDFFPNLTCAKNMLKDSWVLMLSMLSILLYMKIDQLMLGSMVSNTELGKYSAAVRVAEGFYFIPQVLNNTLLSVVVKSKELPESQYVERITKYFRLSCFCAIIIAVSSLFYSGFVFNLLYGKAYVGSEHIFMVYIWGIVFAFIGVAKSNVMLADNKNKITLLTSIGGAFVNILLNLILIPHFKGIGAAIATVISYCLAWYVSSICFKDTRYLFQIMTQSILYPLLFPLLIMKRIVKKTH